MLSALTVLNAVKHLLDIARGPQHPTAWSSNRCLLRVFVTSWLIAVLRKRGDRLRPHG
jgi:hypothetical protein